MGKYQGFIAGTSCLWYNQRICNIIYGHIVHDEASERFGLQMMYDIITRTLLNTDFIMLTDGAF